MIAIIVEDGSLSNPDANSYGSISGLRFYAEGRGIDLTELSNDDCAVLLVRAMDYLEAKRDEYQGRKTSPEQPLQWPRTGVKDTEWKGAEFKPDYIPRELEYAHYAAAIEAREHDLLPTQVPSDQGAVISQEVSGIKVVYDSSKKKQPFISAFAKVDTLLKPLLKNKGFRLVRS